MQPDFDRPGGIRNRKVTPKNNPCNFGSVLKLCCPGPYFENRKAGPWSGLVSVGRRQSASGRPRPPTANSIVGARFLVAVSDS